MADDRSWDDALIVAYLDGELPAGEAARVEAILREDAAAAEAARLMQLGGQAARGAYADAMTAPLPPALAALARPGASLRSRAAFDPARWLGLAGWRGPAFAALAAVVAFGLGLAVPRDDGAGVVRTAAGPAPDTAADEAAAAALLEALETGADGSTVTAEGRQIRIVGPVDPGFAARCRAFRILSPAAEDGVACRGADGAWSVLTLPAATGGDR